MTSVGGASGRGDVVISADGVEYTQEEWWRRQVLERLDTIIELLQDAAKPARSTTST